MSYLIAAAGTGGHVFPGLAVAEALVGEGVDRSEVVFIGGDRLEATVYPREGFPFVQLELQSLHRSFSLRNLALPRVIWRAARRTRQEIHERRVRVVLGMGSYVTVPVGWAARRSGVPLFLHEQNAEAGLANRFMARWANETFVSFPETKGLARQVLTGNPVRADLAGFARPALRHEALSRYSLEPGRVVVGVFGGSLGAGAINEGVAHLAEVWEGPPIQLLHLAGRAHAEKVQQKAGRSPVPWFVVGFEPEMQMFYAACDIVIARAGGAVAEIAATGTPAVLVPGRFGGGHQAANATRFEQAGAAAVVEEDELDGLAAVLQPLVEDAVLRRNMADALKRMAHPDAAGQVAAELRRTHG